MGGKAVTQKLVNLGLAEFKRKAGCDAQESRRAMTKVGGRLTPLIMHVLQGQIASYPAVFGGSIVCNSISHSNVVDQQLWRECENALKVLSMSQQAEVEIDSLYEGYDLRYAHATSIVSEE